MSPGYQWAIYDSFDENYTSPLEYRYSASQLNTLNTYDLLDMSLSPYDELNYNITKSKNFSNRTYAKAHLKITEWLKYNASFQYEYGRLEKSKLMEKESLSMRSLTNSFVSKDNVYLLPWGDALHKNQNLTSGYNFRQQLDMDKTFAEKHNIVALAGFEVRDNKVEYFKNTLYNYDSDMLTHIDNIPYIGKNYYGVWGSGSLAGEGEMALENRYVSLYANAAYTFDKRFVLSGSIRWDRSNLWGTNIDHQKHPIWSAGISWNLDRENFIRQIGWIDMLKLRASYGIGGNVSKNSAPYMTVSYGENINVGGKFGRISNRPNPDLRWEKTATANLGVDFALLHQKLNGTLEFYNRYSSDLLAQVESAAVEGGGRFFKNVGEMRNRGLELTLNAAIVRSGDFSFDVTGILGHNKNEVIKAFYTPGVAAYLINSTTAFPRAGYPYYAAIAYEWAGLSENGIPQIYNENHEIVTKVTPSSEDAVICCGSTIPIYNGSVRFNLGYKNLSLSALFTYAAGHKVRNTYLPVLTNSYSYVAGGYTTFLTGIISSDLQNRWRQAGDEENTDIPRLLFSHDPEYVSTYIQNYSESSVNFLNASNIRISNVALSCRLGDNFCKKAHISGAKLQLNAENLYTFAMSRQAKYMLGGYTTPTYTLGFQLNF